MQMSLAGLHRSILYEILKYCPDIIPKVFPRQWEILMNDVPYIQEDLITDLDAQTAFEALIMQGSFPSHRFCFFVDGLDEYQGDLSQQLALARDLQRWVSGTDVKICASSRPYIEYDNFAPSEGQTIHLHELTGHDIYLFTRQMIKDSLKDDISEFHERLVAKVVDKSEGVFLWARLVIVSLLEGLLRHDAEKVLERKLEVLPLDISGLYAKLLASLTIDDRQRAEKMLLLTAHRPSWLPLSSAVYTFVDELNDPSFPPCNGKRPSTWQSFEDSTRNVRLQLKSLTKGLLETTPESRFYRKPINGMEVVQFFHRTLRDFVLEKYCLENEPDMMSWFSKGETYYRLFLAEIMLLDTQFHANALKYYYAKMDGPFREELPPALLRGFRSTLSLLPNVHRPGFSGPFSMYSFGDVMGDMTGLRFFCLAAYCGQTKYLLEEIKGEPELLRKCAPRPVLLAAAVGGQVNLTRRLLEKGASPMDSVSRVYLDDGDECTRVALLFVFIMRLVSTYFDGYETEMARYWEIFECFLEKQPIDIANALLLLKRDNRGRAKHCITFEHLVNDIRPPNADVLLAVLERTKRKRLFLWKPTHLFTQAQPSSKASAGQYTYTRLRGDEGEWSCTVGIFGDLKIDLGDYLL